MNLEETRLRRLAGGISKPQAEDPAILSQGSEADF